MFLLLAFSLLFLLSNLLPCPLASEQSGTHSTLDVKFLENPKSWWKNWENAFASSFTAPAPFAHPLFIPKDRSGREISVSRYVSRFVNREREPLDRALFVTVGGKNMRPSEGYRKNDDLPSPRSLMSVSEKNIAKDPFFIYTPPVARQSTMTHPHVLSKEHSRSLSNLTNNQKTKRLHQHSPPITIRKRTTSFTHGVKTNTVSHPSLTVLKPVSQQQKPFSRSLPSLTLRKSSNTKSQRQRLSSFSGRPIIIGKARRNSLSLKESFRIKRSNTNPTILKLTMSRESTGSQERRRLSTTAEISQRFGGRTRQLRGERRFRATVHAVMIAQRLAKKARSKRTS